MHTAPAAPADGSTRRRAVAPSPAPRRVSMVPEPASWSERRCPACERPYGQARLRCPADGSLLRSVDVSLPFVWLG